MDVNLLLSAFVLLFFKHFIVDFPMQTRYQYSNKGKYGHPGGILHAGLHTIGTMVALVPFLGYSTLLLILAIAEGVAHYHIDWAKIYINTRMEWECNTSERFWWLLGFDQFMHYMTYATMLLIYVRA
jgi:hypothetical protein